MVGKTLSQLPGGTVEHIGNGKTPHPNIEDFVFEAPPFALRAPDINVRQELHLHPLEAFAFTELTASPRLIEGKMPGAVTSGNRFRHLCQQLAQRIEGVRVGEEIGAGTSPERLLVHQNKIRNKLGALQRIALAGQIGGPALAPQPVGKQGLLDEGTLARTGHPAHPDEQPERKPHRQVFQIVFAGASHHERPVPVRVASSGRNRLHPAFPKISPGQTAITAHQAGGKSLVDHFPAPLSAARPHVDDLITKLDHLRVVLNHYHRIADFNQPPQLGHELLLVSGMQADTRFIEHIQDVHQRRTQGPGQMHPLDFTPGKGPRLPVEGQVFQSDLMEKLEAVADLVHQKGRRRVPFELRPRLIEEDEAAGNIHGIEPADGQPPEPVEQRSGLIAGAAAGLAGSIGPVTRQKDPDMHPVGLALEPFEKPLYPIEPISALDELLPGGRLQLFKRHIDGNLLPAAERHQIGELATADAPRFDSPLTQG